MSFKYQSCSRFSICAHEELRVCKKKKKIQTRRQSHTNTRGFNTKSTEGFSYQTAHSHIRLIMFGVEQAILESNDITGCSWCHHVSLLAVITHTHIQTRWQPDTPPPTSLTACCDAEWRLLVKLTDRLWQPGQNVVEEGRKKRTTITKQTKKTTKKHTDFQLL